MAELDITGLKTLVTKLRYCDDDSVDNVARECAKYLYDSNMALWDTLRGLVENGPLFDGDVPSKSERDTLMEVGLCFKGVVKGENGFNVANQLAWYVHRAVKELTDTQKNDPAGADGVIGNSGSDDSGQELVSVTNATPSVESLEDVVDPGLVWESMMTHFNSLGKLVIRLHRDVLVRYAESLTDTYCDPEWIKQRVKGAGLEVLTTAPYDAKMLQLHCMCLVKLDMEDVDNEFALNAIQHGSNLHKTLFEVVDW